MKRHLITATIDEISGILNTALDDGEWHTPSVYDINLHTHTNAAIYGYCNISKHSSYHDIEHWFNINLFSVNIWEKEYVRNRANKSHFRKIYNIDKLFEKLNEFEHYKNIKP